MLGATRFVADVAASPFRNPPCPVWQVGEGVSPTLMQDYVYSSRVDRSTSPLALALCLLQ
jgi:hypothetical protein